jgi:hypothetical protein
MPRRSSLRNRMPRSVVAFRLLVVAAASTAAACGREGMSASRAAALAQWSRDSIAYEQALAKWQRDSAVLDSIAIGVPVDSMMALWRKVDQLRGNPLTIAQAITCEEARLTNQYGVAAWRALQHAGRRVWSDSMAENAALRRFNQRLPDTYILSGGPDDCGPLGPISPDSVAGVNLRRYQLRPEPPARP